MSSPYWIKLYHEILDDPTMGLMDDHLWRRTIELFLIAGMENMEGKLPPIPNLAWGLHTSQDDIVSVLGELETGGIAHHDGNGTWFITNFAERQRPMTSAERVSAFRNRRRFQDVNAPETKSNSPRDAHSNDHVTKRSLTRYTTSDADVAKRNEQCNDDVTKRYTKCNATCNENVLDIDLDIDKDSEKDREKEGEENHHHHEESDRILPRRNDSFDQMTMSTTPIQLFCQTFKIKSLNERHYETLQSLQSEHGAERLFKAIEWASDRDIPPDRALSAVKTATKNWRDPPKNRSPPSNGSGRHQPPSVFDQVRQELANGHL